MSGKTTLNKLAKASRELLKAERTLNGANYKHIYELIAADVLALALTPIRMTSSTPTSLPIKLHDSIANIF